MERIDSEETGIYIIVNKINKKRYIGSATWSFKKRCQEHINLLKRNKHFNIHLQNSWNKYGENNFEFQILEVCKPEDCCNKENWYLNNTINEYNICKEYHTRRGVKTREETKRKMSLRMTGKKNPMWGKIGKLSPNSRKVKLIDKINNIEYIFNSVKETSQFLKISNESISNILNNWTSGTRFKKKWDINYIN